MLSGNPKIMAVYVDDMYKYPLGQFGRMKMSHMVADTTEELLVIVTGKH